MIINDEYARLRILLSGICKGKAPGNRKFVDQVAHFQRHCAGGVT